MARWAVCAVLLSFFVSIAFPQASVRRIGNRINGRITLPDEQQVPEMITVMLETMAGVYVQETTVNKQRSFSFASVENGLWVIKVSSLGYETTETVVEMRPREELFALVPLGKRLPDSGSDGPDSSRKVVSVTELSVPREAREQLAQAEEEAQKNNLEKAIQHLQKALEIHPAFYDAYNNLAVHYTRLGKTEEAREALLKCVALKPEDARAHRNLAQLNLAQGKSWEALGNVRQAVKLEPDHGTGLRLLGEIYLMLGQYQLGLLYFDKAVRADPREHAYLGMAQCYLGLGQYEQTLEQLRRFLEVEPKGPKAEGARRTVRQLEEQLAGKAKADPRP